MSPGHDSELEHREAGRSLDDIRSTQTRSCPLGLSDFIPGRPTGPWLRGSEKEAVGWLCLSIPQAYILVPHKYLALPLRA
jgi:hypothetical protein